MKKIFLHFVLITLCFFALNLFGADTTETFDVGATDFEFYLGYDGIGAEKGEGLFSAEAVAGFGLMENFSALLSVSGATNEYFAVGATEVEFGIFGTPVDTDYFDLDLFLSAGGLGGLSGVFNLIPAIELNVDFKPNLALAGLYFRVEEILAGRVEEEDFAFAGETALTVGAYYSINENHQILLEYDMNFLNNPEEYEDIVGIGGIALGYNVMVSKSIELINQLYFDIPQKGEKFVAGINIGIVAGF